MNWDDRFSQPHWVIHTFINYVNAKYFIFRGHAAYLQSAPNYNFPMYRQLVHEITQTFKKISDEIIDIENKFRAQHSLPEVAKFIAKIQEEEKNKLETVSFIFSVLFSHQVLKVASLLFKDCRYL